MSKRILVIDSSRVIRTLLQVHLQQAGYEVQVCSSSEEGSRLLRSTGEPLELLFLAVNPAVKEDVEVLRYGWRPA
jgi:DNA-binding response OmpR family regulator